MQSFKVHKQVSDIYDRFFVGQSGCVDCSLLQDADIFESFFSSNDRIILNTKFIIYIFSSQKPIIPNQGLSLVFILFSV